MIFSEAIQFLSNEVVSIFTNQKENYVFQKNVQLYLESQVEKLAHQRFFLTNRSNDFLQTYYPITVSADVYSTRFVNVPEEIEKFKYVAIIGNAGTGKSTLLKYIFLKSVETKYKIPIIVELRNLVDASQTIEDKIGELLSISRKFSSEDIRQILAKGSFLLLLDGFDEVIDRNASIIRQKIEDFVDKFPENRYIITSRPGMYIELLPRFVEFKVESLTKKDIKDFISIIDPDKERNSDFLNWLQRVSDTEYLSNPLMLTLLYNAFQNQGGLPQSKSFIYKVVFDTLTRQHDVISNKNFKRPSISELGRTEIEKAASVLAFTSFFKYKNTLTEDFIREVFYRFKESNHISFDNDKLIFDLRVSYNILVKDNFDYSFVNRELQEYLAAVYISRFEPGVKMNFYSKIVKNEFNVFAYNSLIHNLFLDVLSEIDEIYFRKYYVSKKLKHLLESDDPIEKVSFEFSFYDNQIVRYEEPEYWWIIRKFSKNYRAILDEVEEMINIFSKFYSNVYYHKTPSSLISTSENKEDVVILHMRSIGELFINEALRIVNEIDNEESKSSSLLDFI